MGLPPPERILVPFSTVGHGSHICTWVYAHALLRGWVYSPLRIAMQRLAAPSTWKRQVRGALPATCAHESLSHDGDRKGKARAPWSYYQARRCKEMSGHTCWAAGKLGMKDTFTHAGKQSNGCALQSRARLIRQGLLVVLYRCALADSRVPDCHVAATVQPLQAHWGCHLWAHCWPHGPTTRHGLRIDCRPSTYLRYCCQGMRCVYWCLPLDHP